MVGLKKFGWAFVASSLFAVCGWGETTFGKTIFPLRFYSAANPADSAEQLETWNLLVKYKLFATGLSDGTGLVFSGQNIFVTDTVGYSGSAKGNFKMGGNTRHSLGGPVLFGGKFQNGDGSDTLMTGPVRFLGAFDVSSNGKENNVFRGNYCLDGGMNVNAEGGISRGGGTVLGASECVTGDIVPLVETSLDVPEIDRDFLKTVKYHAGISAFGKKAYIFVPPYSAEDSASFNYFVKSISFGNNGSLVVVMPPKGRLTKIFVEGAISGLGSTEGTDITVAVANSPDDWNAQDSTWDVDASKITPVGNADYQGNLLFYTPNDLSMGAGKKHVQGTFISGGNITIAQHTDFAGQFLAKAIYIDADFSAKDFRYVPFDPPLLDIDPTALASGKFLENDSAQMVPIRLSESPITDVSFNYCFVLSAEADANSRKLANKKDFDLAGMPVCTVEGDVVSGDSGVVAFKKGQTLPTNSVLVTPRKDGIVEGDESFSMYVFNMSGAVLSGNRRAGFFTLYVKDADNNVAPEFEKSEYVFTVNENSPVGTLVGEVLATDRNVGDVVRYFVESGDDDIFALDAATGKITVRKAVLDYESKDTVYTLKIYATDGVLKSRTALVKIRVLDVNEAPTLSDTTFYVEENSLPGTEIGKIVGFDPDSLNPEFSTLSYAIVSASAEKMFVLDAKTGMLSLSGTPDYETVSSYTLRVRTFDGVFADTATVTVRILDVNEAPSVSDAVVTIPEDCESCAAPEKIRASDPDGDRLSYRLVADTSGLFTVDSATGTVSLGKGKILDYERDSVYILRVAVSDPEGLADTATVTVRVLDRVENVKITYAESGNSSWKDPDTIYTNDPSAYIKWITPAGEKDSTVSLSEGKNVVKVRYQDGSDEVVIYLGTKIPTVTISASNDSTGRPSGVTIVERKDPGDSASYVRSNSVLITVSATDSSGEKPKTVSEAFRIRIDTVSVSPWNVKRAESTIGGVTLSDVKDLPSKVEVKRSVVGKDRVKVSYEDKTASGISVTVSYFTDASGKRLTDENGELYYEVSYSYTDSDGRTVSLSYTVDASGTVVSDAEGNTIYTVSYVLSDIVGTEKGSVGDVTVSYKINSAGKRLLDADGNVRYTVSYVYTDFYGNSAEASALVVVDTIPPRVKIVSPENSSVVSNVSIAVRWTVNDIEQDTLLYQGLNEGKNQIIRTYRDKAGNEASDTVIVLLRAGKLITVKVEDPLVAPDKKTVDKFVSASNSKEGTSYALSVKNAKTGLEEETQAGSKNGVGEGSHKEPYEGLSEKHLGVTLGISAQAPAIDETGTLSTLESIVENGYVALDSGGGWDRTTTTVEDFVENYCSSDFREEYRSNGSAVSLYSTVVKIRIWLFTTLGDFVDEYAFSQKITPDFVDRTGGIQMYFELKPDGDGFLKNSDGRLLGSGAYIFKTEVKIRSELRCDLPDAKRGFVRKDDDAILSKWGYRRPKN